MQMSHRLAQCSAAVVIIIGVSKTADAMMVNTFQFVGAIVVTGGSSASPATITFDPDFSITSQDGARTGDLVGLTGSINGSYQFDNPSGSGSVVLSSPTAPNTFTIRSGAELFTANIDLLELQGGGGGSIIGTIDFSTSLYSGTNPALVALDSLLYNIPDLTATFQTHGGRGVDLDELFAGGSGGVASFSAVVSVQANPVPEPAPLTVFGFGLLCCVLVMRRRSRLRTG